MTGTLNSPTVNSQQHYKKMAVSKWCAVGTNRNLKMGFDRYYSLCIGNYGNCVSSYTGTHCQWTVSCLNGNVGLERANQAFTLNYDMLIG